MAASAHGYASPDADDAAVEPTLTVVAGGVAATCPDAVTVISSAAAEVWLCQASERPSGSTVANLLGPNEASSAGEFI